MDAKERAWAEIDLDALESNIRHIRENLQPGVKIMAVVKADAYGHGCLQAARAFLRQGASYLGVACLEEAVQLRRGGLRCPILILGHSQPEDAQILAEQEITPACYDYELAWNLSRAAARLGKRAKLHIKIDTGMGRIGFRFNEDEATNQETVNAVLKMAVLPGLDIEGIFTHFAVADEPREDDYTRLQFKRFQAVCDRLRENGLEIPLKHCCNSAATVRFPEMRMDMVRPGIILYGHVPSSQVDCGRYHPRPAMALKSRITCIKEIGAGETVSYGRNYTASGPTRIGTVAIGYADGFSRLFSGKGQALIGGKLCNLVGNICMDQCMADVSSVNNIAVGDPVILFGRDQGLEITAESLADKLGTIPYEVLCGVSRRIPRIYLRGGEPVDVHSYILDPPVPSAEIFHMGT